MADRPKHILDGGWAGPTPTKGLMLIADITGYTEYLRGSELEHAQNVVADLTEVIITSLSPLFQKSKLEGDAVFAYATVDTVDGSIVLDVVEETYFAFRMRVRDVDLATTCDCNACRLIPSLDLKYVVHSGEFLIGDVAGSEELTGTDVILAHRLLKNTVTEDLGFDAYALLTEACITSLGVNPTALGLIEHTDTYEAIGDVKSYVEDLTERWEYERERRQFYVTPADAELEMVWRTEVPIHDLWEHMTSPELRLRWQTDSDSIEQDNPSGRMGVGSKNHCKHGKGESLEEILDWRPYRYYTLRNQIPGIGPWEMTYEFEELDGGGSSVRMRPRRLRGLRKLLWLTMRPAMRKNIEENMGRLMELLNRSG